MVEKLQILVRIDRTLTVSEDINPILIENFGISKSGHENEFKVFQLV